MFVLCMYTVYGVLFSPLQVKSQRGWPAISVSRVLHNSFVLGKQFGLGGCLLFHSQLAGWGREGECGNSVSIHSVTQPYTTWPRWREQEGDCIPSPCVKLTTNHQCSGVRDLPAWLKRTGGARACPGPPPPPPPAGGCGLGYSDIHNLMRFTSRKMPNNILKNVCYETLVKPFLANLQSTSSNKYSHMYSMTPKFLVLVWHMSIQNTQNFRLISNLWK